MYILSYILFLNKLLLIVSASKIIPGTFWHFSDVFWSSPIDVCINKTVQSCVTKVLRSALERGGGTIPDFIFWTSAGGRYVESVSKAFKAAASYIDVIPALPPVDKHYFPNYTLLSDHFNSWLDENALKTFIKYGYYSVIPKIPKNLKILVLNSALFCRRNNSASELGSMESNDQWNWLFLELSKAKETNQMVYILTSVSPGIATTFVERKFTDRENRIYIKMVSMYSDIIKGQFAGYENGNKFQIFTNEQEISCNWIMLAAPFSNSSRLYIYNQETLNPLDYIQFYRFNESWFMQYRFTNFYLLPNISLFSLDLLVNRTRNNVDLLRRYLMASFQMQDQSYPLCKITEIDYAKYLNCVDIVKNPVRPTPSHRNDCTKTYNNYFIILIILFMLLQILINVLV